MARVAGIFLVLGRARGQWPAPLDSLIANQQIMIETLGAMHAVAARLAGGDLAIRGLLLDPCVLSLADLQAVRTIGRYVRVPVVMLPLVAGSSLRAKDAGDYGVMRWEEAAAAIGMLGTAPEAPVAEPFLPEDLPAVVTDNVIDANTELAAEKSVTLHTASRYDDLEIAPLVSAQEMAALLGALE